MRAEQIESPTHMSVMQPSFGRLFCLRKTGGCFASETIVRRKLSRELRWCWSGLIWQNRLGPTLLQIDFSHSRYCLWAHVGTKASEDHGALAASKEYSRIVRGPMDA